MSEELKPCPGCAGSQTRVIGGPGTAGGPKYWAGCDYCRWRTWGDTEAEAIAAWNTRPAPKADGLVQMVDIVERALASEGVLETDKVRQRINVIALAKALAALKDRDVVLEEAAKICAVMAEDYITGQSKLGEKMPRNAAIAGILQSAEANILALKERV